MEWHQQQEVILKNWGEACSCYRYMHSKAYHKYKRMNLNFMLPIIVMSTVTGTANFAQDTFPESVQYLVPPVIGGLNLLCAIMTTLAQFLKVSELMESHRVSSISYGKLARTIRLELDLPIHKRSQSGGSMVERCSSEYDRLIEQSPPLPAYILKNFESKFKNTTDIEKPEISDIKPMSIFDSIRESQTVTKVQKTFKSFRKDPAELRKIEVVKELQSLKSRNLVSGAQPKFFDALSDKDQLDDDEQQHQEDQEVKDTSTV
jgi:hypothetical protein